MPNSLYSKPAANKSQLIVWLWLGILMVSLCFSWVIFASQVSILELGTEGLNYIEYISSGTQRLVKLELTGSPNDEVIFNLNNTITEISPDSSGFSEYFPNDSEIATGIIDMSDDWEILKLSLAEFRENGDADTFLSSSERHFYHTANLENLSLDYISNLSQHILYLQNLLICQIIIIVLLIGRQLYIILKQLRVNREMSEKMFIDTSTGLFNRSKCQEILKNDVSMSPEKSPAMIVFDLNDLKKTNDVYGHRIGDELISSFAKIIKNATQIFNYDVFVGRYGGDEFIVYYNSIIEYDVKLYLEEVEFLADQFNIQEERYQISFAAGYAISSSETSLNTVRQLFDRADAKMYENKVEMKKNREIENIQK